ncbi:MAG: glycosyltransferase [Gemmatimonadetes bacterium]|nr:glycosyltransferase [Gemmatimonadota bacterium]
MTAAAPRALDAGALSPTPRRIEMVVPSLVTAGMEMVVATLVRALARRGHEVGVTCTQEIGAIGEQLQSEGVPVALVPAPGVLTNFWPRDLARWFASRRPDIVHVHSGVWLKAARAARLAGGDPRGAYGPRAAR